eukprot:gene12027-15129_t
MSMSLPMSVIKTVPISLRAFGYSMKSSNETRCIALQKAVDAHGFEKDDDCDDPTPEPTVPVDDRRNDRFIECMKVLNDKLCKATIAKDYEMINTIVASMTNVIKSTL